MNDIGLFIPFPIMLALAGAVFWRVTLAIAVMFSVGGIVLPWRWVRITCFIIAGVLAADCLLTFWFPVE